MSNNLQEKVLKPTSGWMMLLLMLITLSAAIFCIFYNPIVAAALVVITILIMPGFAAIEPNNSRVYTLFGDYKGSAKDPGFFWLNPFYGRRSITLRARNLESAQLKVNDKMGNPIIIGAIVVWRVRDTFKAAFEVEAYEKFVSMQSEAAVRKLAGMYAYDNIEDEHAAHTLRSSAEEVNHQMEAEISERLTMAGIQVIEARISHLSYASEIAGAMLQRQQASAVVAARSKIVEGAVGMVEMALEQLSAKNIVHLDDDKKAAMVSNLMVVLCSEKAASPVLNAGTLHQ
ncbi:MAG: SPFH domain-containing protein [Saprospiraceae bacterium]